MRPKKRNKREVTGESEKCSGTFLLLFNEVGRARAHSEAAVLCFTGSETGGARGEIK